MVNTNSLLPYFANIPEYETNWLILGTLMEADSKILDSWPEWQI